MSSATNQTTYLVKLTDRRQLAERTMAFQFEKPEDFTFEAGQSINMTFVDPSETDREGNTRTFSLASARNSADRFASQDRRAVRHPGPP